MKYSKFFCFEILPFIGMINNTLSDNYNSNSIPITLSYNF